MKLKPILSAFTLLATFSTDVAARVLTVDNNAGAVAMYNEVWAAYLAAEPGDTLLLSGSDSPYYFQGEFVKQIHIVGNGYFLAENNIPGLSTKSAKLAHVPLGGPTFIAFGSNEQTSSAGSSLSNIELVGDLITWVPLTIDRCQTRSVTDWLQVPGRGPGRLTVRRSFVSTHLALQRAGSTASHSILGYVSIQDGASISNCVLTNPGYVYGTELSTISNCIFARGAFGDEVPTLSEFVLRYKGSVTYSMAVGGSFLPAQDGNINGVASREEVFVAVGPVTADTYWQLKPSSPAIGAGFQSVDLGAFGGATPYILSGLPSLPRITRLVVPPVAISGSGLRFEVTAKSF